MRSRTASETLGWFLKLNETVATLTPAAIATSRIVTGEAIYINDTTFWGGSATLNAGSGMPFLSHIRNRQTDRSSKGF